MIETPRDITLNVVTDYTTGTFLVRNQRGRNAMQKREKRKQRRFVASPRDITLNVVTDLVKMTIQQALIWCAANERETRCTRGRKKNGDVNFSLSP